MAEKQDKAARDDLGQAEVQARVDEATERGYVGTVPDPTPNEAYTLAGVVAKRPTPETDAGAAADARKALGRAGEA